MLRHYFPSTNEGAGLYGGFMHHDHCFCRVFNMKETLAESIVEINEFLDANGYETASVNDFDENTIYENGPVSISPHGYQEQFVLFIDRDDVSKPQSHFLINELKKFRDERDWGQFHKPKDLAIALSIESSELLEQFLWKSSDLTDKDKVKEELADVLAFAYLLAEKYNLDIEEIVLEKIKKNAQKYPVEKSKGNATKYNEL